MSDQLLVVEDKAGEVVEVIETVTENEGTVEVQVVEVEGSDQSVGVVEVIEVVATEGETTYEVVVAEERVVELVEQTVQGSQGPQGTLGPQGSQGPPGEDGTGDATYRHQQAIPATTWVIVHNLSKRPALQSFDSAGDELMGDIEHISDNELHLYVTAPVGGEAYLN